MRKIHQLQIKAQCILFANENGMKVDLSQDDTFRAQGNGTIIAVPYKHIYDQVQNGWSIDETLQNESCYDETFEG
jgi:hypothetical protein